MTRASDAGRDVPAHWLSQLRVGLIPSGDCNLRCRHCYISGTDDVETGPPEPFARLTAQLLRRPIRSLGITGGEFLSWDGRAPLLAALAGASVPVTILSNGTSVSAADIGWVTAANAKLLFSLDGPREQHDALRGQGMFECLKGIAHRAGEAGIAFGFTMTATRHTLDSIGETAALALEWGGEGLGISPYQRLGVRREDEEWVLDESGRIDLLARVRILQRRSPAGFELRAQNVGRRTSVIRNPCAAYACDGQYCPSRKYWPDRLFVLPNGDVVPQSLHIHRQYSLGNVFEIGWDDLLAGYWGSGRHRQFQRLCRSVYQDHIVAGELLVFCWDELLSRVSAVDPAALPDHEDIFHPHDHSEEIEAARRGGVDVDFPLR